MYIIHDLTSVPVSNIRAAFLNHRELIELNDKLFNEHTCCRFFGQTRRVQISFCEMYHYFFRKALDMCRELQELEETNPKTITIEEGRENSHDEY